MPEFDFKNVGTIIGAATGAVGIAAFKDLFARPETLATRLREALDGPLALGPSWVKSRRNELAGALLFPLRLLLSVFYLVVIVGFVFLVSFGPDRMLNARTWGTLAEPLTPGEQMLHLILVLPVAGLYAWLVAIPAFSGWRVLVRASLWLRKHTQN